MPQFDTSHMLYVTLFGIIVTLWSVVRVLRPIPLLIAADTMGRAAFSLTFIWTLTQGHSAVVVPFLVLEVAFLIYQALGVRNALRADRHAVVSHPARTPRPASCTSSPSSRRSPRSSSATPPVLTDARYVLGAGADTQVLWGGLLEVLTALACIGTAVVLYPVVRRQHEGAALGFVTARVLEAGLIVTGIVSMLSVVTLRRPDAAGADASALVVAAEGLVAVHDWTFLLGPGTVPGINALLLGHLMYRSGLVPRIIPLTGLVGAPLFLLAAAANIVGINEPTSIWTVFATLPIFAWELSLGLWLLAKGFRPSPVLSASQV